MSSVLLRERLCGREGAEGMDGATDSGSVKLGIFLGGTTYGENRSEGKGHRHGEGEEGRGTKGNGMMPVPYDDRQNTGRARHSVRATDASAPCPQQKGGAPVSNGRAFADSNAPSLFESAV